METYLREGYSCQSQHIDATPVLDGGPIPDLHHHLHPTSFHLQVSQSGKFIPLSSPTGFRPEGAYLSTFSQQCTTAQTLWLKDMERGADGGRGGDVSTSSFG